jgi:hypothetical protein
MGMEVTMREPSVFDHVFRDVDPESGETDADRASALREELSRLGAATPGPRILPKGEQDPHRPRGRVRG